MHPLSNTTAISSTSAGARRYLILFALAAAVPLAVAAVTNYVLDPFQYFRRAEAPWFSTTMMRYQTPGLIRNYQFDAILVGSSNGGNFRKDMFAAYRPNIELINLVLFGGTLNEQANDLKLALADRPLKVVFFSIPNNLAWDYRFPDYPHCLHSKVFRRLPYCYLFNVDVLREGLAPTALAWVPDLDQSKAWSLKPMSLHQFACATRASVGNRDAIEPRTRAAEDNLDPLETPDAAKFAKLVLPIVSAHPNTLFVFFFSPVYVGGFWQISPRSHRNSRIHQAGTAESGQRRSARFPGHDGRYARRDSV